MTHRIMGNEAWRKGIYTNLKKFCLQTCNVLEYLKCNQVMTIMALIFWIKKQIQGKEEGWKYYHSGTIEVEPL